MKRKLLLIIFSLSLCSFTACGVSQSEYDAIILENESLISQNNSLQSKLDEMTQKNIELTEEKIDSLAENTTNQYVEAWMVAAFGDKASYFIIKDRLYVNVFYADELSTELVTQIFSDYKSSISLYGAAYDIDPENMSFELTTINFYDHNNDGVLGSSFKVDGGISPNEMMINLPNFITVTDSLKAFSN